MNRLKMSMKIESAGCIELMKLYLNSKDNQWDEEYKRRKNFFESFLDHLLTNIDF
jgi:hypothetical protein